MIFTSSKNVWTPSPNFGQPKYQKGILHPVGFWGGSGDTVDLQDMTCEEFQEGGGGAGGSCRMYNVGFRDGEGWYQIDGVWTYNNDIVVPASNANEYEMKWDSSSGDPPSSSSAAEGVWYALSSGDFTLTWSCGENEASSGSTTVSIRKGTGSTLDTATWSGDVESVFEPE